MKLLPLNDLGEKFLVEECQRFEINSFCKRAKKRMKESLLASEIKASGLLIELTTSSVNFGGVRYWFKCPLCSRKVGTLFVHPLTQQIACRGCLGLEYKKRRYRGMVESL